MASISKKMELNLGAGEVSGFLKNLAAKLEGKEIDTLADLPAEIAGFTKIEIGIKQKKGETVVKLKAKYDVPDAEEDCQCECDEKKNAAQEGDECKDGKEKYKDLKKRMKKEFKAIEKAIEKDELPAAEVLESFIADSKQMTTYEGKGDELYSEYLKACDEFAESVAGGNLAEVNKKLGGIKQMMKEAHGRFK